MLFFAFPLDCVVCAQPSLCLHLFLSLYVLYSFLN